jgi:hypothetical protein
MTDKPRREKGGGCTVLALGLVLLPMIYVLSLGPAARLVVDDKISMGTYRGAYAPIVWCEDRSSASAAAIQRYRSLFADEDLWGIHELNYWHRLYREWADDDPIK